MAEYNLVDVVAAAQRSDIEYRGRKVYRDIMNLGYELGDVVDCISKLTTKDFKKMHRYNSGLPDDAYVCTYRKSNSELEDRLYIKFSLVDGCLEIDLASFHLS